MGALVLVPRTIVNWLPTAGVKFRITSKLVLVRLTGPVEISWEKSVPGAVPLRATWKPVPALKVALGTVSMVGVVVPRFKVPWVTFKGPLSAAPLAKVTFPVVVVVREKPLLLT
jgi:hypothetical protein